MPDSFNTRSTADFILWPDRSLLMTLPSGPMRKIAGIPLTAYSSGTEVFAQETLEPFQVILRYIFLRHLRIFIQTEANHHEPLIFGQGLVGGLKVGSFGMARAAPGGPEVKKHELAAKVFQFQRLAVQGPGLKKRRRGAD